MEGHAPYLGRLELNNLEEVNQKLDLLSQNIAILRLQVDRLEASFLKEGTGKTKKRIGKEKY